MCETLLSLCNFCLTSHFVSVKITDVSTLRDIWACLVVIFGPDSPPLLLFCQIATIQTPLSLSSLCVGGRGMLLPAAGEERWRGLTKRIKPANPYECNLLGSPVWRGKPGWSRGWPADRQEFPQRAAGQLPSQAQPMGARKLEVSEYVDYISQLEQGG